MRRLVIQLLLSLRTSVQTSVQTFSEAVWDFSSSDNSGLALLNWDA